MIEQQHGKVIIACDSCDETFEGEPGDLFETIWAAAKRERWTARKIANEWLHGCPSCGIPT